MRRLLFSLFLLLPAPGWAQLAKPVLTLPPCTGARCLDSQRGSTTPYAPAPSIVKATCPQGTVYDAYKGTCRVMPGGR